MKMIKVQTTGNFMLVDRLSGHEIMPGETPTVPHTSFIDERLATKELIALGGTVELTGTGGLHEALTGETPTELTGLAAALAPPPPPPPPPPPAPKRHGKRGR